MKRVYFILLTAFIAFTGMASLFSCGKSDTQKITSRFTWTYNGITYTAKQDTARLYNVGGSTLIAGLETSIYAPGSGPRMTLTGLNAGTYTFGAGSANSFEYIDMAGFIHAGTGGSLQITRNANNLLDGNFSVTLTNSNIITGEFSNTPVK